MFRHSFRLPQHLLLLYFINHRRFLDYFVRLALQIVLSSSLYLAVGFKCLLLSQGCEFVVHDFQRARDCIIKALNRAV